MVPLQVRTRVRERWLVREDPSPTQTGLDGRLCYCFVCLFVFSASLLWAAVLGQVENSVVLNCMEEAKRLVDKAYKDRRER